MFDNINLLKLFISIIVIATDPSILLKYSVESALSQTLRRQYYEIIVVKNFKEKQIDEFLSKNGIINLYTEDRNLGRKVALATQIATGDIISLLDYDDMFSPLKLESVMEAFLNSPDLEYYHNDFTVITNDESAGYFPPIQNSPAKLYLHGDKFAKMAGKLKLFRADFNNSCISIKKTVLLNFLELIGKIKISLDQAIFYICLNSQGGLLIDSKILTLYRIHDNNSSLPNSVSAYQNEFQRNKIWSYETNRLNDLTCLLSSFGITFASYLIGDIGLIKISRCLQTYEKGISQKISLIEYLQYVKSGGIIIRVFVAMICFLVQNCEYFNIFLIKIKWIGPVIRKRIGL